MSPNILIKLKVREAFLLYLCVVYISERIGHSFLYYYCTDQFIMKICFLWLNDMFIFLFHLENKEC